MTRKLLWRGTSKSDFKSFPDGVQREMGYALYVAQMGDRHPTMTKTLTGFQGGAVLEIRENDAGGT